MREHAQVPGQVYAKDLDRKKQKQSTVKSTNRAKTEYKKFNFINCFIQPQHLKFPKLKHKN